MPRLHVRTSKLFIGLLVLFALMAVACSASIDVADQANDPAEEAETETADPQQEEPEPAAPEPEPAAPEPDPAAPEPGDEPASPGVPSNFSGDAILGISTDGRFAYAGTTSPWQDEVPCDGAPRDVVAVIDIDAVQGGEPVAAMSAGLEQAAVARQGLVGDNEIVILAACGPIGEGSVELHSVAITSNGQLSPTREPIELSTDPNVGDPFLLRLDGASVEYDVLNQIDPDDPSSWLREIRQVNRDTGEITVIDQRSLDGQSGGSRLLLETADGFSYRSIDDPNGSLGCEGFGVARTIEVDDGTTTRVAIADGGPTFSSVGDLHIAESGHIAWTSSCEGFVSVHVGKVQPDGTIIDAHFLELNPRNIESFVDYRAYQLISDGILVAVGQTLNSNTSETEPAVLRFDLSTDPNFVNTSDPAPVIQGEPLFTALDGVSTWHVGETLGAEPECGGATLYSRSSGQFARAFPSGVEIATIVDADVAEEERFPAGDGGEIATRYVVVQTECQDEWEGRQVWFGIENESPQWGLFLQRADLVEVADVLSVRSVSDDDPDFLQGVVARVEYLDGTVDEVPLINASSN